MLKKFWTIASNSNINAIPSRRVRERRLQLESLERRQLMATNIAAIRPDPATTNTLLTWLVDRESLTGPRNPIQELSFQFGLSNASIGSSGINDRAFVGDWSGGGFEQAAVARPNVGLGAVGVGDLNVGGTQVLLDTDRDGSVEYAFNMVLPGSTPVVGNRPVAGNLDQQFGDDIALTRTEVSGGVGYKHWYAVYAKGSGDPFPQPTTSPRDDATFSPHLVYGSRTDAHFSFGLDGDFELVGDISGDGLDDIIAVHPLGGTFQWYVHKGSSLPLPTSGAGLDIDQTYVFGSTTGIPVLGDWDGNGVPNMGVITNDGGFARWNLDFNGGGAAEATFVYGLTADQFVVGRFPDVQWTTSQTDSWNSGGNWSTGGVPGVTSWIGIDQPGTVEVQHNTNTVANIGSISSREPISVSAGALYINQPSSLTSIDVSGGELRPRAQVNLGSFQMSAGMLSLGTSNPFGTTLPLSLSGGQIFVPSEEVGGGNSFSLNNPIQLSNTVLLGGTGNLQLNGTVGGSGNLLKSYNKDLTLNGVASYTGATLISQGKIVLGGSERLPDNGAVDIAAGAALNLATLSETVGPLSGAGNIELGNGAAVLTTNASIASTLTGNIVGTGTFIKQGPETLTMTGALSMLGALQVSTGTLAMNGSLQPSTQLFVASSGTLKGTGVTGSTTIAGTLSPGQSPGILRTGNLGLLAGSNLNLEFGGVTAGNTASNYDQLQVTGSVSIASTAVLNLAAVNGFAPTPGQQFVILTNDGTDSIAGNFAGLAENALIDNFVQSGWAARISYHGGDGNDIVLSVINRSSVDLGATTTTIPENAGSGYSLSKFTTVDPDVHDSFLYTLVAGVGATDNSVFQIDAYGFLHTVGSLNFETKSSYSIRVRSQDLGGNQIEKAFLLNVQDLPEMIGLPTINDGSAQRSFVTHVSLTFEGPIAISNGAFAVTSRATGLPVVTSYESTVTETGQTIVSLNFVDASTRGQVALNDGYYELVVDGSKIRRGTAQLDANQDGVAGDTYRFGTVEADRFFSLFGDTSGDAKVDVAEFGQFRNAFGKQAEDPGYSLMFDYNFNGAVSIDDFGKFRDRFGKPQLAF